MIYSILFQPIRNNKKRKLNDIRVRNALNNHYRSMVRNGHILHFKIVGVKTKNRVQSACVKIIPCVEVKEITVNVGFTKS